jgi:dimethylargininase
MYYNAVVISPCPAIVNGLSSSGLGKPDYKRALEQHTEYVGILKQSGLNIELLPENELFPDSTFIEDVAICTSSCAVITRPGALSRRGEIAGIRQALAKYYDNIEEITNPGTLEGGDVMMAENHFFIGISGRTNIAGADQLIKILEKYKFTGSKIPLEKMLHLKSGVSYLENNKMIVSGEFVDNKSFGSFERIIIDEDEIYAANSLWINGTVLVPEGFPKSRKKIEKAGYNTIAVNVSEFRKVDGGLSCLSLRF